MTTQDIINSKHSDIKLFREDLISETETENWRTLHPTGPVHTKLTCLLCGSLLMDDLPGFGHLDDSSFWRSQVAPHFISQHISEFERAGIRL